MLNWLHLNESGCCCESEADASQRMRSRQIDHELREQKKRMQLTQKIALLGPGESGKSTFLKQMQIIHGDGFTRDDCIAYRTLIYENILRGMAGLLNGKKELKLPWRGSFSKLSNEQDDDYSELAVRMKDAFGRFAVAYKRLLDEREKESVRLNKKIEITPVQFNRDGLVNVIYQIWNDHSIREAYDRRREFPKYFVENIPYFIENLDRIGSNVFLIYFYFSDKLSFESD